MKNKKKPYGDEVTDFYDKKIPKVDSNHTCLALTSLDSAVKKDDSFYQQVFLKECKCTEKNVIGHIIDDLQSCSNDSDNTSEEKIKHIKLIFVEETIFEDVFFDRTILKMYSGCLSSH